MNSKPAEALNNILVSIDFSDHAQQALTYAKEIATSIMCGYNYLPNTIFLLPKLKCKFYSLNYHSNSHYCEN